MKSYNSLITNKKGQPLKILIVGHHFCIRCIRIGQSLKSVGYEVDALTNKISYGTENFDKIAFYHNEQQFKNFINAHKDYYDIISCENEPDVMIKWARDVIGESKTTKLIHSVHDSDLIRRNFIPVPERQAYNSADAVIYVSEPIQKICNDMHRYIKPTIVLYNYPTQSMIDTTNVNWNLESRRGLVYEGGVNPIGDDKNSIELNSVFPYRNLFPLFKELIAQGNEVHVYAGNSDATQSGQTTGCIMHPPTIFDKLLDELSRYRYNIIIFNNKDGIDAQVNFTTPNKLWDALAAGVPSLACYCQTTMDYVKKHDIGWTFDNMRAIGDCSQLEGSYQDKIATIKRKRQELIFERQIWKNELLYATLLGVEKKEIPDDIKKQAEFEYGVKETQMLLSNR